MSDQKPEAFEQLQHPNNSPEHCSAVTFEKIEVILRGIDKSEMIVDYGWWETSIGAEFGAVKLAEIKALFYPHNKSPD